MCQYGANKKHVQQPVTATAAEPDQDQAKAAAKLTQSEIIYQSFCVAALLGCRPHQRPRSGIP